MTEEQLEQRCLQWFEDIGWEVSHGPAAERSDYRQVLLGKKQSPLEAKRFGKWNLVRASADDSGGILPSLGNGY